VRFPSQLFPPDDDDGYAAKVALFLLAPHPKMPDMDVDRLLERLSWVHGEPRRDVAPQLLAATRSDDGRHSGR